MRISDWSSDVCSSDLHRAARTVVRGFPGGGAVPAPPGPDDHPGRQHPLLRPHSQPAGAPRGCRVRRDPALRAPAGELDVDARDDGRRLGRSAHPGDAGRAARTRGHRLPGTPVPRRHALHRYRDPGDTGVLVATGPGHRHDAAHRPLAGGHGRGLRDALGADVAPGCGRPAVSAFTLGPALLFCPADRPERFAKAAERADAVILDLEDAVAPGDKTAARGALIEADIDPARTIVRVSAPGTDAFVADVATLSQTDFRTVMVAKTESAKALQALELQALDERFRIVALCETAKGVAAA